MRSIKRFILTIVTEINRVSSSRFSAFFEPVSILSLVAFRIGFGLLMLGSLLRFILKGWVSDFYIEPVFHFTYLGFSWVRPFSAWGMYGLFILLVISAGFIALGLFYRWSIVFFFLGFTYIELIDKSFYLNHYYAISLFAFLMMFLPLNRAFSVDVSRGALPYSAVVPAWCLWILRFQIALIYFFAGVAKLNIDWLFHAQPLTIWLQSSTRIPVVGPLLAQEWVAYVMSWAGAIYDLFIPFLLMSPFFRIPAYLAVVAFHAITGMLFNIGVFPWVMMVLSLVFFNPDWPKKWSRFFVRSADNRVKLGVQLRALNTSNQTPFWQTSRWIVFGIVCFFVVQVALPFRYLLYPGPLFWREEGFRFSWRVMLIEKVGMIDFRVVDPDSNRSWIVTPSTYLNPIQARMMATQPDMILAFSHYLGSLFKKEHPSVQVFADSYVTLNGRPSAPFIDPTSNLFVQKESLKPYTFILPQPKITRI